MGQNVSTQKLEPEFDQKKKVGARDQNKESLFSVEKQKIITTLASTTSEEEWQERLKAASSTQAQEIEDEVSSSPTNYLQDNGNDNYGIMFD
ncbi:hypothetical protein SESBI_19493 [Sesbania bispinosa]|nr:hypothetical protein SESBI_19493 [Sesbania bispinosa]